MNDLPTELVFKVLNNMSKSDVICLSKVNVRFGLIVPAFLKNKFFKEEIKYDVILLKKKLNNIEQKIANLPPPPIILQRRNHIHKHHKDERYFLEQVKTSIQNKIDYGPIPKSEYKGRWIKWLVDYRLDAEFERTDRKRKKLETLMKPDIEINNFKENPECWLLDGDVWVDRYNHDKNISDAVLF